ncbi:MAG: Mrp/NBP35 family ATP-binding protein [Eubacteriales bacterium]|nr:Mrp/NBP35 family ATP-binding protein [Eubacteriales bacterium]
MAEEQMTKEDFRVEENAFSNITHVIGVVSGKGGVGKSMVTASLANAMAVQGYTVGILDADITGPSIPKMYGIQGGAESDGNGIYPPTAANGIEIMSTNLLLPDEGDPVVWRGPVIGNMVKQFYTDVIWGQLDYLFVDMPPGTGDVPLTVFQSLPVDGIVIVTSPQDLVRMIVTKAYRMAQMMEVPVLGIVENYSYLECPHCSEKIYAFGQSHIDEIAADLQTSVLGKIPMQPAYAQAADEGKFADVLNSYVDDAVVAIRNL